MADNTRPLAVIGDGNSKDVVKRRNKNWTDTNEIRTLIYTWEQNIDGLIKMKRNRFIYERMSKDLEGFGYHRSADEIRCKIKNLSAMYRREKVTCTRTGDPSEWLYYESIHRFLDQNRSYSEELLNDIEDTSHHETISFRTGSKPVYVMVTEKNIKQEPVDDVDIDDRIVLSESTKSHSDNENSSHSQEQNLKHIEKSVSFPQTVAENSLLKLPQNQNVEKTPCVPQPLVFLLPRQFVNQTTQNKEKFPPTFQLPANSVAKQSKTENVERIPSIPHQFDEKLKQSNEKVKELQDDVDSDEEEIDLIPSKKRKKNFEDALESLPLTLQSSILERLDSLSRHIETNTCALSILSKAVSNMSDSTVRIVSAVNNLSKSINNIGSTLDQLLQRKDE